MLQNSCSTSGQKMTREEVLRRRVPSSAKLYSSTAPPHFSGCQAPSPTLVSIQSVSLSGTASDTYRLLPISAAKCAVRALADTLRMEVLRYNCSKSLYSIHCAFPADFVSPGFLLEHNTKTPLTKRMQGVDKPVLELQAKFPSSEKVASQIIAAVDKGEFIICEDSFVASLLFTSMIGPSPKRGWGIVDGLLSPIIGWFVWPILRWRWEAMTRQDGKQMRASRI